MSSRVLAVTVSIVLGSVLGLTNPADAFTWSFYKTTTSPLSTTYIHGGTVARIQGFGMTTCSTGSWTKYTAVWNGPGVVDGHVFQGTSCPSTISYAHSHPSSYAVCKAMMSTGTYYANCPQGIV